MPVLEIGLPVFPDALERLAFDLADLNEETLTDIASRFVRVYKEEVEAVEAVATRFFIDTIHVVEPYRTGERIVKSDAPYSGIVEYGWLYRGEGQESYPGRNPAARAIARFAIEIEDAYSAAIRRF